MTAGILSDQPQTVTNQSTDDTLRRVATLAQSSSKLREMLGQVLERLQAIVAYDMASITLIDGDVVEPFVMRGLSDQGTLRGPRLNVGEVRGLRVMRDTQQPLLVTDLTADPCEAHFPLDGDVSSWMGVPLILGGRVIGFIIVGSLEPASYGDEELSTLAAFAHQPALLIENVLLTQELAKYQRHCHELSEELTQQLEGLQHTQTRLLQYQKMAAVGQLVAWVAHELNNPLTTVVGYAQIVMRARDVPEQVTVDLRRIRDAASRCAEIVRKLLTFARQNKPVRCPTDINEVVRGAISIRSKHLRAEAIQLDCDLEEPLPPVLASPQRLQELLLDLINDAEEAISASQHQGTITVRSRSLPGMVRLEVEDDGPAIPADIVEHVFEPFFTAKEACRGTGPGLTVCYGIVQDHEGRIWAESGNGPDDHGTIFVVELPVDEGEETWVTTPPEGQAQRAQTT